MAIQKTLSLENNFGEISNVPCYIRVTGLRLKKLIAIATIDILKLDQSRIVEQREFSFEIANDSGNAWAQTYDFLKTMPTYSGAKDC